MTDPVFCDVTPETLDLLETALAQLAHDLDDPYTAAPRTLHRALFEQPPACHAILALGPGDTALGAALFSPVMSTVIGAAGAYVTDLWVAETARGRAFGPRLLAQVAQRADQLWQARFLRLVSYRTNLRARSFYTRLGFTEHPDELVLRIDSKTLVDAQDSR